MTPGEMYLGLFTGGGIGAAAQWVTVILFLEVSKRSFHLASSAGDLSPGLRSFSARCARGRGISRSAVASILCAVCRSRAVWDFPNIALVVVPGSQIRKRLHNAPFFTAIGLCRSCC